MVRRAPAYPVNRMTIPRTGIENEHSSRRASLGLARQRVRVPNMKRGGNYSTLQLQRCNRRYHVCPSVSSGMVWTPHDSSEILSTVGVDGCSALHDFSCIRIGCRCGPRVVRNLSCSRKQGTFPLRADTVQVTWYH